MGLPARSQSVREAQARRHSPTDWAVQSGWSCPGPIDVCDDLCFSSKKEHLRHPEFRRHVSQHQSSDSDAESQGRMP